MVKEKEVSSEESDDLDLFDETDMDGIEPELVQIEPEEVVEMGSGKKINHKLEVKKRLDAYLERKWFKDHGWEDDDDLFNDDFFSESEVNDHKHM